ncbi:MAG: PqqD family peptide modification chaperone, partial [Gemmataceae bacterium]
MPTTHDDLRQGRKQIRPRLRRDLAVSQQRHNHKTCYVVKDPVRLRYFRFTEQEYFLLERLDGKTSTEDLRRAYEQRYRPQRLPLEDVEVFLRQLIQAGLVGTESSSAARPLLKRRRQNRRRERIANLTNVLAFRIRVCDPDRFLNKLLPVMGGLFSPLVGVCALALVLSALLLVGMHFQELVSKLPDAHAFFTFKTAIYLWVALGCVKVLHELGHGLTCKAFGGEVHETGLMFLCLAPCLYCEVSDSWMLPSKRKRMLIGLAGIFVELIVASIATFVWWYSTPGSMLHQLSLCLVIVCSVNTLLFNGNPLLRYDGYFVLADFLDMPNLKMQSSRVVKQWLGGLTLGLPMQLKERLSPGRRAFLLTYGILSSIYLTIITVGVFCFIHGFLKPHKLEALTWIL